MLDEIVGHERKVVLPNPEELELVERRSPLAPMNIKPYATDESLIPEMADFGTDLQWHVTGLFHDKLAFQQL